VALIAKELRTQKKEQLNTRIDPEVLEMLRSYCEFVDSSLHYVVERALRYTFHKDKEFQAWLLHKRTTGDRNREEDGSIEAANASLGSQSRGTERRC
jgi:hypothetical protein